MDNITSKKVMGLGSSPTIPQRNIKGRLTPTDEALKKHMDISTRGQTMTDESMGHHGESKNLPVIFTPVKLFERTSSQSWRKVRPAQLSSNHQSVEVEQISKFPYMECVQCPRMIRTLYNFREKTTYQNLIKRMPSHQKWSGTTDCTYKDIRSSITDIPPLTGCQMTINGINTSLKRKAEKPKISDLSHKEQRNISSSETPLPPSTPTPVNLVKYSTKGLKSGEIITKVKTGLLRRNKKRDFAWCTFKEQQDVWSSETHLPSVIVNSSNSFNSKEIPVRKINKIDTGHSQRTGNPQVSSVNFKKQQSVTRKNDKRKSRICSETQHPPLIVTSTSLVESTTSCPFCCAILPKDKMRYFNKNIDFKLKKGINMIEKAAL